MTRILLAILKALAAIILAAVFGVHAIGME